MQAVPGGKTGLLVRQIRSIEITTQDGAKKKQVITEFVVDAVMLKEARAHEQLAAMESGQWQNNDTDQSAVRGKVYIGTPDGEEEAKPLNADALATAGKGLSVQ